MDPVSVALIIAIGLWIAVGVGVGRATLRRQEEVAARNHRLRGLGTERLQQVQALVGENAQLFGYEDADPAVLVHVLERAVGLLVAIEGNINAVGEEPDQYLPQNVQNMLTAYGTLRAFCEHGVEVMNVRLGREAADPEAPNERRISAYAAEAIRRADRNVAAMRNRLARA